MLVQTHTSLIKAPRVIRRCWRHQSNRRTYCRQIRDKLNFVCYNSIHACYGRQSSERSRGGGRGGGGVNITRQRKPGYKSSHFHFRGDEWSDCLLMRCMGRRLNREFRDSEQSGFFSCTRRAAGGGIASFTSNKVYNTWKWYEHHCSADVPSDTIGSRIQQSPTTQQNGRSTKRASWLLDEKKRFLCCGEHTGWAGFQGSRNEVPTSFSKAINSK